MHTLRRRLLLDSLKLFDLALLATAFLCAAFLISSRASAPGFAALLSVRLSLFNAVVMAGMAFVWHAMLSAAGLYHSHRLTTVNDELGAVLKGVSLCVGTLLVFTLLWPLQMISLGFINMFWLTSLALLGVSRLAFLLVLRLLRRSGRNLRRVLVAGCGVQAREQARLIAADPSLGYVVEGFVQSRCAEHDCELSAVARLVCDTDTLRDYLRNHSVDEILVCLPLRNHYDEVADIIRMCEEQGILTRIMGDMFDLRVASARVESLHGKDVLTVSAGGMHRRTMVVKEMLDVCLASLLLLLLSPLMLLAALAIKLSSPGPVLFAQERLGINKRCFRLYKFRTMTADAEQRFDQVRHLNQRDGPAFKLDNDPRVTTLGRLLRKLSIDELPQLFNVLRGDMSLVGPRPLLERDYEGFDTDWHRRRFSVRPGITCLWQISGRNNVAFDRWMQMDMEYIDRWSLWLDLQILLRTIPVVLLGLGAS